MNKGLKNTFKIQNVTDQMFHTHGKSKNKTIFFQTLFALLLIVCVAHLFIDTVFITLEVQKKIEMRDRDIHTEVNSNNYILDKSIGRHIGPTDRSAKQKNLNLNSSANPPAPYYYWYETEWKEVVDDTKFKDMDLQRTT